jgi:hypothetical protein
MTRLRPSFFRVFLKVGLSILLFLVFCDLKRGFQEGKWWEADDILVVLLLMTFAPAFVWFAFVPFLMEFSDSEIKISTLLGKYTYSWDDLYCYGTGRGVYKIQFSGDRQPYQIFKGAYPKADWIKLVDFMTDRYPNRIASGFSFGPGMSPRGD